MDMYIRYNTFICICVVCCMLYVAFIDVMYIVCIDYISIIYFICRKNYNIKCIYAYTYTYSYIYV